MQLSPSSPVCSSCPASRRPCKFLDQSLHCHSLRDKMCSCLIHRLEQAPTCVVDPSNLRHVDFDPSTGDRCGTPGVFGFRNPGALESACKMQPPEGAVLLNCDSQHFGFPGPPSEAHVRGQVSQPCIQLSGNGLKGSAGLRSPPTSAGFRAQCRRSGGTRCRCLCRSDAQIEGEWV